MKRRRLLGFAGASLAGAGCTGRSSPGSPPGDSPTVTDREFSRTGDCDDPERATVSFPDDVVVTGCISGPNGCAEAALERVDYDSADDTLRIVVGTVDISEPNEACTEAIVHRAYELRIGIDGSLPGAVVVVHRGAGDEIEAARVER